MSETNGPTADLSELSNEQLYDILRGVTYEANDISLTDGEIWEDILNGAWYTQIACQAYAAGTAERAALREQLDIHQRIANGDCICDSEDIDAGGYWVTKLNADASCPQHGERAIELDRLREQVTRLEGERDAARAELDAATTGGEEVPARPPKLGPGFVKHAAREAIEYHLKQARRYQAAWNRYGDQLGQLLLDRVRQIEAGQWPPRPEQPAPAATRDGGGQDGATA